MTYDFETIWERKGMDAAAVDMIVQETGWANAPKAPQGGFSVIPMWVADMNFATAPSIPKAIIKRTEHPLYGYFEARREYYDAIIDWHSTRNGVKNLTADHIGYENGVLGCLASAVSAFTAPGEKILLHSPTYIGFTHALEDTGRVAELSPLKQDENGVWRMDYEDMDRRLKEHKIHFAILCSPHNPCGRVWERWELEKAMEVYRNHDCVVISDEIWSDILLNGARHTPTQSVSEDAKNRTIAIYAPSKTFNLAGLIGSYHIIYNSYLRDRIEKQSTACHYNEMNLLSMYALMGAYSEVGQEWTDELCQVLSANINYAYDFIQKNFAGVSVAKPEGTYMLFLHCEEYCKKAGLAIEELLEAGWSVGVAWQDGTAFHDPWGIRMNFAVPHQLVEEAMDRLKKYVFKSANDRKIRTWK